MKLLQSCVDANYIKSICLDDLDKDEIREFIAEYKQDEPIKKRKLGDGWGTYWTFKRSCNQWFKLHSPA